MVQSVRGEVLLFSSRRVAMAVIDRLKAWVGQRRKRQYVKACEAQLPEALDLLANSLKAGLTFMQGMNYMAEELDEPLSREFKHVVQEHRLGLPLEESFQRLRDRVPSESLNFALAGVLIARQSGGDLPRILKSLAEAMREREKLRQHMRAMTSQGRLSGWIVGVLPFALAGTLGVLDPTMMKPLVTTVQGGVVLGVAIILEVVGILLIRRIVTLEV